MTFQNSLQNQALRVTANKNSERIQAENRLALQSELSGMKGSGHVSSTTDDFEKAKPYWASNPQEKSGKNPQIQPLDRTKIGSYTPVELADLMAELVELSLTGIYLCTKEWAGMSVITTGTTMPPTLIVPPGNIQPRNLSTMAIQISIIKSKNLPAFAEDFAIALLRGYGDSFATWLSTLSISAASVFPAGHGPGVPLPMSEVLHGMALIDSSMMNVNMLSKGAELPRGPNSQSTDLSDRTRKYVAQTASGMLKFSLAVSYITGLHSVGNAGPNGTTLPGVLMPAIGAMKGLGENLPTPETYAGIKGSASLVNTSLRSDLVKSAYKRVGAPTAP